MPISLLGLTDLEIIAEYRQIIGRKKLKIFIFDRSDKRVLNVMKQAEFFGYSGEKVKGLIFCSRIDEAVTIC